VKICPAMVASMQRWMVLRTVLDVALATFWPAMVVPWGAAREVMLLCVVLGRDVFGGCLCRG